MSSHHSGSLQCESAPGPPRRPQSPFPRAVIPSIRDVTLIPQICRAGCENKNISGLLFCRMRSRSRSELVLRQYSQCGSVGQFRQFASIDNLSSSQETLTEDKTPPERPLLEDSQIECALFTPAPLIGPPSFLLLSPLGSKWGLNSLSSPSIHFKQGLFS